MLSKLRQLKHVFKGQYANPNEIASSYDDISVERVRDELETLVEDDVLEQFSENYYVVADYETEEEKKEILKKLSKLGHQLHSDADTRKEVKVSGSMVEDKSFKTDKSLDEIIR